MRREEYLEDEFRHQLIVNVNDEYWSILASYRAEDQQNNDFYLLICNETTRRIDKALAAIDSTHYNVKQPRSINPFCLRPRMSFERIASFFFFFM